MTVDCSLGFDKTAKSAGASVQLGSDFIVIETKSKDGRGIADSMLKKLRIRKASACSKYCIGVNLTGCVGKNNRFLATIKRATRSIVNSLDVPVPTARGHSVLAGLA